MEQKEFEKQCPLFPSFPNYTKAMYEGNEPCSKGHKLTSGEFADRWDCMYGGGETADNEIIHASFSINRKITIHICGDSLWIVDLRYYGKSDVWEYSNNGNLKMPLGACCNAKSIHQLEPEKIEKILSEEYDCKFWRLVQKRAKELYNNVSEK